MATNEEIREVLRSLADKAGRLTPEAVVKAARDPHHPLHNRFEWDDRKAGHAHRLDTARGIISIVVEKVVHKRVTIRVPVWSRDPSAEAHEQGYRRTAELRREPYEAHRALANEMARVSSIIDRAKAMAIALGLAGELAKIDAMVQKFVSDMDELRADD